MAHNGELMWANFIGTTIGEWRAIILALGLLPAQFASYLFPLYFIGRVSNRRRLRGEVVPTEQQVASKTRLGLYLIASGTVLLALYHTDNFMLYQGAWDTVCGFAIFIFGKSFWASSESYKPPFRVPEYRRADSDLSQ